MNPLLGNIPVYMFQRIRKYSSCALRGPCYNALLDKRRRCFLWESDPRLYNGNLFAVTEITLENLNWQFRSCRSTKQQSEDNWVESSELGAAGSDKKGIRQ
jgi:hypothetical protein